MKSSSTSTKPSVRWPLFLAAILGVIAGVLSTSPTPASANPTTPTTRFYAATGQSVSGAFLRFYDRYGGVDTFGYPISGEMVENGRTVQYFERQRFEYHKEAAGTENEVQLGHLGKELASGRVSFAPVAPFKSTANRVYVRETGHSVSQPFLEYWRAHGEVRILGYPISEPVMENGRQVQYFERARMEYHPNKAASGYAVQLGLLGREYLRWRGIVVVPQAAEPQAQNAQAGSLSQSERQLLDYINGTRAAIGVAPVALDARLTEMSRSRSNDMASRGYFSHKSPEGTDFIWLLNSRGVTFKFTGEVLAMNNQPESKTAQAAFEGFMKSPPHKAIILDPRYNAAGTGTATNSQGMHYLTTIFIQK